MGVLGISKQLTTLLLAFLLILTAAQPEGSSSSLSKEQSEKTSVGSSNEETPSKSQANELKVTSIKETIKESQEGSKTIVEKTVEKHHGHGDQSPNAKDNQERDSKNEQKSEKGSEKASDKASKMKEQKNSERKSQKSEKSIDASSGKEKRRISLQKEDVKSETKQDGSTVDDKEQKAEKIPNDIKSDTAAEALTKLTIAFEQAKSGKDEAKSTKTTAFLTVANLGISIQPPVSAPSSQLNKTDPLNKTDAPATQADAPGTQTSTSTASLSAKNSLQAPIQATTVSNSVVAMTPTVKQTPENKVLIAASASEAIVPSVTAPNESVAPIVSSVNTTATPSTTMTPIGFISKVASATSELPQAAVASQGSAATTPVTPVVPTTPSTPMGTPVAQAAVTPVVDANIIAPKETPIVAAVASESLPLVIVQNVPTPAQSTPPIQSTPPFSMPTSWLRDMPPTTQPLATQPAPATHFGPTVSFDPTATNLPTPVPPQLQSQTIPLPPIPTPSTPISSNLSAPISQASKYTSPLAAVGSLTPPFMPPQNSSPHHPSAGLFTRIGNWFKQIFHGNSSNQQASPASIPWNAQK